MLKLNIGGGRGPVLEGYEIVDRSVGKEAFPLDYRDESVDEIRASHVLEHFSHRDVPDVLKDWARVLKPGGRMQIAVPDFEKIVAMYQSGEPYPVESYIMGGHVDENDYHKSLWDVNALTEAMRLVGLNDIRAWTSPVPDCAALPVSLNLEGYKRPAMTFDNIVGAMSIPRLMFSDNVSSITVLPQMGIPVKYGTGVFWGQALQTTMEEILEHFPDAKYILTIDYDTPFRRRDVEDLYMTMERHPEVDALCPLQMGRERSTVLLTIKGEDGKNRDSMSQKELAADVGPIATGHFGLTLLRVDKLRKMSKPWFTHSPDPNGKWHDGRIDDDIYFWRKWVECGNSLYLANKVVVGHLQLCVTWPDRQLRPVFQFAGDYRKKGMPWEVCR